MYTSKRFIHFFLLAICCSLFLQTCKVDPPIIDLEGSAYPDEVGKILLTKCAVKGCHNDKSKDGAAGLSLQTWERLFEGTRNGTAVMPFTHTQSTLFMFTNTYDDLGIKSIPTMPIAADPLSKDEVLLLRDWIAAGAPDKNGYVKFSENSERKKIYVTNQGCDAVTVFDAASGLPMRYISIGHGPLNESPHMIRVAPDGKHWYVCFLSGEYFQKYRTSDDSFVGEIQIGFGGWNTFAITKDSKYAFAADLSGGAILYLDIENLTIKKKYSGSGLFLSPHGTALNKDDKFLYATAQYGNYIYKINITNPLIPDIIEKTLDGSSQIITAPNVIDPHEIAFSPDYSKYFVTCQYTNEVRVFKASNDSLIAKIPTGTKPQEMSFSQTSPYLFVTCTEDTVTFPGKRGSVAIINYETNTLVKSVFTSWQPHGIAVDDDKKLVYVANRNASLSGPAPHHSSDCGGRNGNVSYIDLLTLTVVPQKTEVSVDPYSIAYRR
jgi:DNA-binding beta-propeller fold protein YncE